MVQLSSLPTPATLIISRNSFVLCFLLRPAVPSLPPPSLTSYSAPARPTAT